MDGMVAAHQRSNPFSRSRGIEKQAFESFHASLSAEPHRKLRILGWTYAREGFCIGTPSHLSLGDTGSWQHIGWHQFERGDWNAETQALRWALYGGTRGTAHLQTPARLPELFRERIAASIVIERFIPVRGTKGIIISARRNLADQDGPLDWHRSLSPGLTWDERGVEDLAELTIADLRTEYDIV